MYDFYDFISSALHPRPPPVICPPPLPPLALAPWQAVQEALTESSAENSSLRERLQSMEAGMGQVRGRGRGQGLRAVRV